MAKKKENRKMKQIIFITLCALSSTASAGSIACSGTIEMLFAKRDGMIELYANEVYGSGHGRTLCNTVTAWKGIAPETCKVWYSNLLSLSAQNKPAVVYYLDSEVSSCGSVAYYNDAEAPWGVADKIK